MTSPSLTLLGMRYAIWKRTPRPEDSQMPHRDPVHPDMVATIHPEVV